MDELISIAVERALQLEDIAKVMPGEETTIGAFCDKFARELVLKYQGRALSWSDADAAINNITHLMHKHCERLPNYSWSVYLAFDAGESTEPGAHEVTDPLLAEIQHVDD